MLELLSLHFYWQKM